MYILLQHSVPRRRYICCHADIYSITHWGRVTHICVGKLTIVSSDNGLSPGRRQAIIWTNAGILVIGHLRTNFSEMLIEIHTFLLKKIDFKMSSGKWRPSCLGLNVIMTKILDVIYGFIRPKSVKIRLCSNNSQYHEKEIFTAILIFICSINQLFFVTQQRAIQGFWIPIHVNRP